MAQKVDIVKNETHWQSANIKTMVLAALKHSTWKPDRPLLVEVSYTKESWGEYAIHTRAVSLDLCLPKRGPRLNSALRALASAAVSDQPILPVEVTWWMARQLAYEFMHRVPADNMSNRLYSRREGLHADLEERTRPSFLPADAYITRYAKPKPPRKKTFLEKVEDDLSSTEENLAKWEKRKRATDNMVKSWRKELKKQQKRLRDGRASATARGERVEMIGPGHRLQGRI